MSYTPTTWSNGDTITAAKLNKLEQGVAEGGGGADIVMTTVSVVDGNLQMDKTFAEIKTAILAGKIVIVNIPYSETDYTSVERYVASFYENTGLTPEYVVNFMNASGEAQNYAAASESGYPAMIL